MSNLKLTILGNGSAVPTSFSNPSSQLLNYKGKQFMIDCGEGTQMQMIKFKIKHRNLNYIFISHLHGDHFYGLIGLLSTFHLYGREKPLIIFAPEGLGNVIKTQLEVSKTVLKYDLQIKVLGNVNNELLLDDEDFQIHAFELKHSVPSWGFVFREKLKQRKIKKEFIVDKELNVEQIISIKKGNDFIDNTGKIHSNSLITNPPPESLSYAYCSDTAYYENILEYIEGVTYLYHEATFDKTMEKVAIERKHSTAEHAAMIAKKANVKKLLLGHFSARFSNPGVLLEEAKEIFPNTILSREGQTYFIRET